MSQFEQFEKAAPSPEAISAKIDQLVQSGLKKAAALGEETTLPARLAPEALAQAALINSFPPALKQAMQTDQELQRPNVESISDSLPFNLAQAQDFISQLKPIEIQASEADRQDEAYLRAYELEELMPSQWLTEVLDT